MGLSFAAKSALIQKLAVKLRNRAGINSLCTLSVRNCASDLFFNPKKALMPDRKKNMGIFQAFMVITNHNAGRCQTGTVSGIILKQVIHEC